MVRVKANDRTETDCEQTVRSLCVEAIRPFSARAVCEPRHFYAAGAAHTERETSGRTRTASGISKKKKKKGGDVILTRVLFGFEGKGTRWEEEDAETVAAQTGET